MVGVFTFHTSFNGELSNTRRIGASFCHGLPPNQGVRKMRVSLRAYMEIQSAAPDYAVQVTPLPFHAASRSLVSVALGLLCGARQWAPVAVVAGPVSPQIHWLNHS
jgi:hypothetical protein